MKAKTDNDENLNETLETVFRHIEESAKGSESESDFEGLFDDFDVNSNKLGSTVAKRNEKLAKLLDNYRFVNGSLRKGDIVDVYAVDPASEMFVLMAENVYVSAVYDNAGKKITDDEGVATSFTVWVTPEEVESINTAVVYGGIQMYLKTK